MYNFTSRLTQIYHKFPLQL